MESHTTFVLYFKLKVIFPCLNANWKSHYPHFYIKFHLYDNFVWIDSFSDISPTWNPVFRKDIGIFWLADVADWKPIIERANIPPNLIKSRENIVPFLHLTHNLSRHIFFSGIQKIRMGIITFCGWKESISLFAIHVIYVWIPKH